MTICDECENLVRAELNDEIEVEQSCIFGIGSNVVIKCSHFKAKLKDNKELKEQAKKALKWKGKNIPDEDRAGSFTSG